MPAIAPVPPHPPDDVVQMRMGQRLAAGDADHGRSETPQVVDAPVHLFERHGLGNLVVLVAVGAAQVAEARGHDLGQDWVRRSRPGRAPPSRIRASCGGLLSSGRAGSISGEWPSLLLNHTEWPWQRAGDREIEPQPTTDILSAAQRSRRICSSEFPPPAPSNEAESPSARRETPGNCDAFR